MNAYSDVSPGFHRRGLMRSSPLMLLRLLFATLGLLPLLAYAQAPTTVVVLQKQNAGTFYIDGAIQGYGEVTMLVDTGSSYLVISEVILSELKQNGQAEFSRELEGIMADGSRRVVSMYRLTSLRLGKDCWIQDVEAAVFPGATRPILGMNVLAHLAPFTFSAEPPALALNSCRALAPIEHILTSADAAPTP